MTKANTAPTPGKTTTSTAQLSALVAQEPDLVDRIFEYLLAEFPQIAGDQFAQAKTAVRAEFSGETIYIPARGATDRQRLVQEVLSLFNGRNTAEVARRLRISKASVYRYIKQARLPPKTGNGQGA
jgi:Mor family transcriptional regulator